MLNPRCYLEDCVRQGKRGLWYHGMPWQLIINVMDKSCYYNPSDDVRGNFTTATHRPWDNKEDQIVKNIKCPICQTHMSIPWTTASAEENAAEPPSLMGYGWGDSELNFACGSCGFAVDKKLLSVAKFVQDTKNLLSDNMPMPGTVIHPSTGKTEVWEVRGGVNRAKLSHDPLTFPNRLIKMALRIDILEMLDRPRSGLPVPDMDYVRKLIEEAMKDTRTLEKMESKVSIAGRKFVSYSHVDR